LIIAVLGIIDVIAGIVLSVGGFGIFQFNPLVMIFAVIMIVKGAWSIIHNMATAGSKGTKFDFMGIFDFTVGLLLLSFALASIGLLCSALATNQLVAALSAYAVSMAILDFSWMMEFTGDTTDRVLQYLSLMTHMGNFPRGVISLADIVYFAGLGLGGFLLARVSLALERIN